MVAERKEKPVGNEFNVLFHKVCIHAEEPTWQSISEELLFDSHSFCDDILHSFLGGAVVQMGAEFLSQKMDAKEPLKNMPSTAAKATRRDANVEFLSWIQRIAQSAFFLMHGTMNC